MIYECLPYRKIMHQIIKSSFAFTLVALSTGCSMMAPQYSASINNVQTLKNSGASQIQVTQFNSSDDKANSNPITIRGSSLVSPYNASYSTYLTEALKQELKLANRFSVQSNIDVSGVLLKNDIDASGFSTGYATVEARFIVKRDNSEVYNQIKSVKHEFPSSFAGAVAIPRAIQEYSFAVQKLLGLLYEDKAFIEASK